MEPAQRERAFQTRPATVALKANDLELRGADRALRNDGIDHRPKMRVDLNESQAFLTVL